MRIFCGFWPISGLVRNLHGTEKHLNTFGACRLSNQPTAGALKIMIFVFLAAEALWGVSFCTNFALSVVRIFTFLLQALPGVSL